MAKNSSGYSARRSKRGSWSMTGRIHPLVVVLAVAVLAFAAWVGATGNKNAASLDLDGVDDLLKVVVPAGTVEQIVDYPGFTVSFNSDMHQPNYVAWELTCDEASATGVRESDFAVDPSVDGSAALADYRNSGFDRGHMIPAADVKWSREAMRASHYLTNICPQYHKLNAGAWATLEGNCRTWAERDSAIIIICGPILTDRMPRTIGKDNVIPVPERFFKVVLSPYSNPPRGIGFLMPNAYVDGGVQTTAVSIDEVEAATGFDFFSSLPDEVEADVESQCAYHVWQRKKP